MSLLERLLIIIANQPYLSQTPSWPALPVQLNELVCISKERNVIRKQCRPHNLHNKRVCLREACGSEGCLLRDWEEVGFVSIFVSLILMPSCALSDVLMHCLWYAKNGPFLSNNRQLKQFFAIWKHGFWYWASWRNDSQIAILFNFFFQNWWISYTPISIKVVEDISP